MIAIASTSPRVFRPLSPSSQLLWQSLVHARAFVLRAVIWAALRQCAFLAMPWVLGRAIDAGVKRGSVAVVAGYAGAFVLIAIVEYIGIRGWQLWTTLADAHTGAMLRTRLLRAVLAIDTDTMHRRAGSFGDLTTRATRDTDAITGWVHGLTAWVVIALTGVVLVPAIGGLDPLLLVVAALTVPVLLVVNRLFPPLFSRRAEELSTAHSRRSSTAEELLSALPSLRGVGADRWMVERHHAHSAQVTGHTMRLASVSSVWEATASVVPLLAVATGLLAGGHAVIDGRITVGALTTFVLWMGTVSLAVNVVIARLGDRTEARVAAVRIADVLALAPESGSGASVEVPRGALRVEALTVNRPGRSPIGPLELTAVPGEWVVLTGATGSGKSTLLRAIAGLVPASGTVKIADVSMAGLCSDDVFRTVGFVPEGPLLLHGTVTENLLLGGDRTEADIERAARAAGLDLALAGLTDGHDTQVGERGGALSGGQRQLVTLARTLLRDCPVLLLDDVTSALDAGTEAQVLERLRGATADRVVVFATHSPAVRAMADREVVLHDGHIDRGSLHV